MKSPISFALTGALCLFVFCFGCAGEKLTPDLAGRSINAAIPRADPGYLQQLERHSMLALSSEMARVVSGSELAWSASASEGKADGLQEYADVWVHIHPLTILTDSRRPAFAQLNSGAVRAVMGEVGAKGIYLSPLSGGGALWNKAYNATNTGDDIVQYAFSQYAGKESDYRSFMNSLLEKKTLLGSDLIPAATGLGPDFFLAARGVREYPGIYCMVDIPKEFWKSLPELSNEFDTAVLSKEQVLLLSESGILPKAMRDEGMSFLQHSGWAVTGVVRGVDGNDRRWVYRYYQNRLYAVLNWEDPSQAAHRILSASAVRQVGLLGQAFIGLRFEAFQGLEPTGQGGGSSSFSVEPALTASKSMSRQIRRYGGFSWLRDDNLPLTTLRDFLRGGPDYVFDSAFSPAAEHALLTEDASFLRFMADEVLRLNIDGRRLVHTTPGQDGVNYTLPHLTYLASLEHNDIALKLQKKVFSGMRQRIAKESISPFKNGVLYSTGAGLAAMSLGLDATQVPGDKKEQVAKGHVLLVLFKAMQPGILMMTGQDMTGALPLPALKISKENGEADAADAVRGAYAFMAEANNLVISATGVPKTHMLYGPADTQVREKKSFVLTLGMYLKKRESLGISSGTLVARPKTQTEGAIALMTKLSQSEGFVLSVCNFSQKAVTENIILQDIPGLGKVLNQISSIIGGAEGYALNGSQLSVTLAPWQGKFFLFGKGPVPKKEEQPQKQREESVLEPVTVDPNDLKPVMPAPKKTPIKTEAAPQEPSGIDLFTTSGMFQPPRKTQNSTQHNAGLKMTSESKKEEANAKKDVLAEGDEVKKEGKATSIDEESSKNLTVTESRSSVSGESSEKKTPPKEEPVSLQPKNKEEIQEHQPSDAPSEKHDESLNKLSSEKKHTTKIELTNEQSDRADADRLEGQKKIHTVPTKDKNNYQPVKIDPNQIRTVIIDNVVGLPAAQESEVDQFEGSKEAGVEASTPTKTDHE